MPLEFKNFRLEREMLEVPSRVSVTGLGYVDH